MLVANGANGNDFGLFGVAHRARDRRLGRLRQRSRPRQAADPVLHGDARHVVRRGRRRQCAARRPRRAHHRPDDPRPRHQSLPRPALGRLGGAGGCLGVALVIQNYTRLGRYMYALGGGEELAALSGIPVARVRILVFTHRRRLLRARRHPGGGAARSRQCADRPGAAVHDRSRPSSSAAPSLSGGEGGVLQTLVGVLIVAVLLNGMVLMGVLAERSSRRAGPDDHRRGRALDRPQAPADRQVSASGGDSACAGDVDKRFPGVHALKPCRLDDRAERGRRPHRRERRRQVDADEDPRRRLPARLRRDPARRQAGPHHELRPMPMRKGIGMVFQEQSLLPNLSVGENIYLGNEAPLLALRPHRLAGALRGSRAPARQGRGRRRPAHARRGPRLRHAPDGRARQGADARGAGAGHHSSSCSTSRPRCWSAPRSPFCSRRVRALKSRAAFVFVSHRLDEVLELSDRVYVMKDGEVVAEALTRRGRRGDAAPHDGRPRPAGRVLPRAAQQAPPARTSSSRRRGSALAGGLSRRLVQASQGRDPRHCRRDRLGPRGAVAHARRLRPARRRPRSGSTARRCASPTPAEAVDNGIGYLPRERRIEGLVLFLSVAANITLPDLPKGVGAASSTRRRSGASPSDWVKTLGIKTPGIDTLCLDLSGGNQQKVVLAKWLQAKSRILILDHPTRGLDVGAKEEVYELVRACQRRGHRGDPHLRHAGGDDRPQPQRPRHARRRDHPARRGQPGRKPRAGRSHRRTWSRAMKAHHRQTGADR